MYQRDYLLIEVQKFTLMLSRLLGLKAAGKLDEFNLEVQALLQDEFDSNLERLLGFSEEEFTVFVQDSGFSAEKLNALAQILYLFAQPMTLTPETLVLVRKVLLLFDYLAEKHQYTSFQNAEIANVIYRFLSNLGISG
ncbi:hypothetical protein [Pedobacter sp. V48]|uniref:hypothetical protein n=1 Tax=Pedobacter sp. V48 TaxID=509635 RepID=UPI0003E578F7|nr:hypothetical protein [Pedobacter sp. V48]ETZ24355.1 hypothetical protein N824_12620 [Pedobacter sp. V48]